MEEKDAVELLGKLKKFMEDTTKAIMDLQISVHNLKIDVEQLKKNQKPNLILTRN